MPPDKDKEVWLDDPSEKEPYKGSYTNQIAHNFDDHCELSLYAIGHEQNN